MLIPSIDIQDGQAVQLRQGKTLILKAGDPRPLARAFGMLGEIAVIDLDAAMGKGHNRELIQELLTLARCRVGGGIRDVQTARSWLDAGAAKVILGTAATPEILSELPRERTIAALDAKDGEVVVEGWVKPTGKGIIERIHELRSLVSGFLVTFVEIEGTLAGLDAARVVPIVQAAGKDCRVTAAGGVKTASEVGALDRIGADAQVGMAIYRGLMDTADAYAACLTTDRPDQLWPTVICDERGTALGLAYSSAESLREAVRTQRGVYYSRSRQNIWRKGETSGSTQELLRIDTDCDRDTLRFIVRQSGTGFCHTGTHTCWGQHTGLSALEARVQSLATQVASGSAPQGSYTSRLLTDHELLASKIREEARELTQAQDKDHITREAADLIYFATTLLTKHGLSLNDVGTELDRRALKLSRRGGESKGE